MRLLLRFPTVGFVSWAAGAIAAVQPTPEQVMPVHLERSITAAQAGSSSGPTGGWELDAAISRPELQAIRDRAYRYCFEEKSADGPCFREQDLSLRAYVDSFALIRDYRSRRRSRDPWVWAHQSDPTAFDRARTYCWSIYADHGSRDARLLGPCLMSVVGGDFFGVVPIID